MEKQMEEMLVAAGVQVQEGIGRVAGNESLYRRLLDKFLQDKNYDLLWQNLENKDWDNAKVSVHTLKGLSANLGMADLNRECIAMEQSIKGGQEPNNQAGLKECYEKVAIAIKKLAEQ